MTEEEWNACADPTPMLEFLRGKATSRKLRLFECACVRRIWHTVIDPQSRRLVEIVERSADTIIGPEDVAGIDFDHVTDDRGGEEPYRTAFMAAGHVGYNLFTPLVPWPRPAFDEVDNVINTANCAGGAAGSDGESAIQAALLREIFGNPFNPVTIDPSWLAWNNTTIVHLAQAIYDDRAFDRMPILADALEDAGCHDPDILAHCRGPGPHCRGCWLVDLILGRE